MTPAAFVEPARGGAIAATVAGTGIGLRGPHLAQILRQRPPVPWFEVLADNYLAPGFARRAGLDRVRADYPLTLHCVGMDLGGADPLDSAYLRALRDLIQVLQPAWVSDHLCFTRLDGLHYHDLLPLPFTEAALRRTVARVQRVQDYLGQAIAVENVSSYLRYRGSTLEEGEFLAQLCVSAGCGLLVDINNAYVTAANVGGDPETFLSCLPSEAVWEVHLGGHDRQGSLLVDTHDHRVSEAVWSLYERFVRRMPHVPTLIEWDNELPNFEVLQQEAARATRIAASV